VGTAAVFAALLLPMMHVGNWAGERFHASVFPMSTAHAAASDDSWIASEGSQANSKPGQPIAFDYDHPEANIPTQEEANANPLEFGYYLMELARSADQAEDAKDWEKALKVYRAMSIASPKRGVGPRKACALLISLKRTLEAEAPCRAVLVREDSTLADFSRWLRIVVREAEKMSPDVLAYAHEAIEHLRKQPGGELTALQAACELAVHERTPLSAATCVPRLLELAPDEVTTLIFAWQAAVEAGQEDEANAFLERIRAKGVPQDAIDKLMNSAAASREDAESAASCLGCGGGSQLLLALILIAAVLAFRRMSIRT
jgi:hypothetical protein